LTRCAPATHQADAASAYKLFVYGGEAITSHQFTGRDSDGTGLQYNRARYYNPERSRFLSEDPIGFAAGDPNL
jgi:RHS repeat-associated protein